MALVASIVLVGIAIGLLLIYAADIAASSASGSGFLPLDHMQRGLGLGGPALVLPVIAFFISKKEPSRMLGVMIIVSGIMIIAGGVAVLSGPTPGDTERDPASSAAMLFGPAAIQLALGGIKIAKS